MKNSTPKESKPSVAKIFLAEFTAAVFGVARIAFMCASGAAAYVLWFSSDSLTLKVIAAVLVVQAGTHAVATSVRKK